jgi:hypothetical protein
MAARVAQVEKRNAYSVLGGKLEEISDDGQGIDIRTIFERTLQKK